MNEEPWEDQNLRLVSCREYVSNAVMKETEATCKRPDHITISPPWRVHDSQDFTRWLFSQTECWCKWQLTEAHTGGGKRFRMQEFHSEKNGSSKYLEVYRKRAISLSSILYITLWVHPSAYDLPRLHPRRWQWRDVIHLILFSNIHVLKGFLSRIVT